MVLDEQVNGKIVHVSLGTYDFGYMSYMLYIETTHGERVFGTHDLRLFGVELIERILYVVGVNNWSDLKEKYVRVKLNTEDRGIEDVGHILENKWIDLKRLEKRIKTRNRNEEMEDK